MISALERTRTRQRARARRVRARIRGTAERPRLSVFRSHRHITAQLIDDEAGRTVAAASDGVRTSVKSKSKLAPTERAARVGEEGKLFGSVTSGDIAAQLEAQGIHVEKRQIDLPEPIKALGVYKVGIRLHADVMPEIKVWVIKG